jgi:hypothetical protein
VRAAGVDGGDGFRRCVEEVEEVGGECREGVERCALRGNEEGVEEEVVEGGADGGAEDCAGWGWGLGGVL